MSVHSFQRVQNFQAPLPVVWKFFSNPSNLAVLTPGFLNLKFTNDLFRDEMYPGQIIMYKVKPLLGIPFFWMTEITQVKPMEYFIDEQRRGPFSFWHHQHHFAENAQGVEMTDLIHYRIPLGRAGALLDRLIVKKKLDDIFEFRTEKARSLVG